MARVAVARVAVVRVAVWEVARVAVVRAKRVAQTAEVVAGLRGVCIALRHSVQWSSLWSLWCRQVRHSRCHSSSPRRLARTVVDLRWVVGRVAVAWVVDSRRPE